MPQLILQLDISAAEMLRYYRGEALSVRARATNGQTVQFPAAALQRLVTPDGIHGRFRIEFDQNYKFVRLEPVSDV